LGDPSGKLSNFRLNHQMPVRALRRTLVIAQSSSRDKSESPNAR